MLLSKREFIPYIFRRGLQTDFREDSTRTTVHDFLTPIVLYYVHSHPVVLYYFCLNSVFQALSDGKDVPYSATLRIVDHEGSAAPIRPPIKTKCHAGFKRNELGGFFTS